MDAKQIRIIWCSNIILFANTIQWLNSCKYQPTQILYKYNSHKFGASVSRLIEQWMTDEIYLNKSCNS